MSLTITRASESSETRNESVRVRRGKRAGREASEHKIHEEGGIRDEQGQPQMRSNEMPRSSSGPDAPNQDLGLGKHA